MIELERQDSLPGLRASGSRQTAFPLRAAPDLERGVIAKARVRAGRGQEVLAVADMDFLQPAAPVRLHPDRAGREKRRRRAEGSAEPEIGTHFRLNGPRPADYQRPARDSFTHEDIIAGRKTMTVTIDEDISLLARVQQGMASSGFESVWLSDEEARVQHFHNALDAALAGA